MLLTEGGAAGHAAHPYELEEVKTGNELRNLFLRIPEWLPLEVDKELKKKIETGVSLSKKLATRSSLKWDGSNNSIKIIDRRGKYEFALDRGSTGGRFPIDPLGVTTDDFDERRLNMGLRSSTEILLDQIMNPALEAYKPDMIKDLKDLGLIKKNGEADTTKFLNTEYIQIDPKTRRANLIEYPHSAIVFHGINEFYEKKDKRTGEITRPGAKPRKIKNSHTNEITLGKETSRPISYNRTALDRLVKKIIPFARKQAFEVYAPVATYVAGEVKEDLTSALQKALEEYIEVNVSDSVIISKNINDWFEIITVVPNYHSEIRMKDGKKRSIYHRDLYDDVIKKQLPVLDLIAAERSNCDLDSKEITDCQLAIFGPVIVEITRILGVVLLKHLKADIKRLERNKKGEWEGVDISDVFGNLTKQEGIIVNGMYSSPFKITGDFILQSKFGAFAGLEESFTVAFSEKDKITKPINVWLSELEDPRNKIVEINGKSIAADSEFIYNLILKETPLPSFIENGSDVRLAIAGAICRHLSEQTKKKCEIKENLIDEVVRTLFEEKEKKRKVILYPGRFQPMGRHHLEVFHQLENKWGKGNVYIITSDKVVIPKSPLNFEDKKAIMIKHGIPENQILFADSPYRSKELDNYFDPSKTTAIYAVGKKDMNEDPRFANMGGVTKSGSPAWFKDYEANKNNLETYNKHGYIMVAPHVSMEISGFGEMCGTSIRACLKNMTPEVFEGLMGWFDEDIYEMVRARISNPNNALSEAIFSLIREVIEEKFDSKAQQGYLYANNPEAAKKLGSKMTKKDYENLPEKVKESEEELEEYRAIGGDGGSFSGKPGPPIANCKQCCQQCKCPPKKDPTKAFRSRRKKADDDPFDPIEEISAVAGGAVAGNASSPRDKIKGIKIYTSSDRKNN